MSQSLATPTIVGQTSLLTRLDGRVVARAAWDGLPYWLRAAWQSQIHGASEAAMRHYLERDASPVVLALVAASDALPDELRRVAEKRLKAPPSARLVEHFQRLLDLPRDRLLAHLGAGDRADPAVDRLDLLAEVVALREAQTDLRSERALVRAFRTLFRVPEPFAVWCLIAFTLAAFLVVDAVLDPGMAARARLALRLEPGLDRPWSWVGYAFVHTDARHVLLNMIALAGVGPILELVLGVRGFLLAYLACTLAAGLASTLVKTAFDLSIATVGASGAVAGCAALALVLGLRFRRRWGRVPARYAAMTLGGALVWCSAMLVGLGTFGVDHAAHIGGLLAGTGIGLWLAPRLDARYGSTLAPA
ncbi:MAG: rhomboid family intramembrane serine protease [Myxococcota bacterium]